MSLRRSAPLVSVLVSSATLACNRFGDCEDLSRPALATAFLEPCHPRHFNAGRRDDYVCCSDDPAAAGGRTPDFDALALPDTETGQPLFAGKRSGWSEWGQCMIEGFDSRCSRPSIVQRECAWPFGLEVAA